MTFKYERREANVQIYPDSKRFQLNYFKLKKTQDIINSLNANTLDSNGAANQSIVEEINNNTNNPNPNMASNCFSLTHKRSDICVEWTDSVIIIIV